MLLLPESVDSLQDEAIKPGRDIHDELLEMVSDSTLGSALTPMAWAPSSPLVSVLFLYVWFWVEFGSISISLSLSSLHCANVMFLRKFCLVSRLPQFNKVWMFSWYLMVGKYIEFLCVQLVFGQCSSPVMVLSRELSLL